MFGYLRPWKWRGGGLYTDVIIIFDVSTLRISIPCSEKSSLLSMVDLSLAYMALPCFGWPRWMIRCIPCIFGGDDTLCVSWRYSMYCIITHTSKTMDTFKIVSFNVEGITLSKCDKAQAWITHWRDKIIMMMISPLSSQCIVSNTNWPCRCRRVSIMAGDPKHDLILYIVAGVPTPLSYTTSNISWVLFVSSDS